MLPGVVRRENKAGGPPCSLVYTQICLVVFPGMCLSTSFVHGRGSLVMVCTRYLSLMRVSSAGTGLRALVHSAPLTCSALLPPPASSPRPSFKASSVLFLLGISLAAVELGLSALRPSVFHTWAGPAWCWSPAVVIAQDHSRRLD